MWHGSGGQKTYLKVHNAALRVGEAPVVEHLEEDVEDRGVRLLHLFSFFKSSRRAAVSLVCWWCVCVCVTEWS